MTDAVSEADRISVVTEAVPVAVAVALISTLLDFPPLEPLLFLPLDALAVAEASPEDSTTVPVAVPKLFEADSVADSEPLSVTDTTPVSVADATAVPVAEAVAETMSVADPVEPALLLSG